jgi:hypothetical protein
MIKPEGVKITNHAELKAAIMHLNAKAAMQEQEISRNVKELYYDMQPLAILKRSWKKLVGNPEVRDGAASIGFKIGASILASRLFRKSGVVKGFFGSVFIEKITEILLNKYGGSVNNGMDKLTDLLKDLKARFSKKSRAETGEAF